MLVTSHRGPPLTPCTHRYTSSTLQFGKVDLGQWPSLALEMKIDTSPSSTQLPTLVLFKGGKAVTRMPHQPSKQPFVSGTSFRKVSSCWGPADESAFMSHAPELHPAAC